MVDYSWLITPFDTETDSWSVKCGKLHTLNRVDYYRDDDLCDFLAKLDYPRYQSLSSAKSDLNVFEVSHILSRNHCVGSYNTLVITTPQGRYANVSGTQF